MKMSDMFDLPLDCSLVDNANIGYAVELECDKSVTEDQACAVDYAINNHDRMAGEIAELKGALVGLIEDVGVIYSPTGRCGCDEKHYTITSGEIDDIKLLLAKLNQEGGE
ncbi:hypothetical protein [Vibrio phage vB_VcM_SY]